MKLKDKVIGCLGTLVLLLGVFMVFRDPTSSAEVTSQAADTPVEVQPAMVEGAGSRAKPLLPISLTTQSVQPDQQGEKGFFSSVKLWWRALSYGTIGLVGIAVMAVIMVLLIKG